MYVFDIDGTLANAEHRLHLIKRETPDWESFFSAEQVSKDAPVWPIIKICNALYNLKEHIVLLTGRNEVARKGTLQWLNKYFVQFDTLIMRPEHDYRPDHVIKPEMLRAYLPTVTENDRSICTIFEDRSSVVKAWRDAGFHCCQVADGDF